MSIPIAEKLYYRGAAKTSEIFINDVV